MNAPTPDVQGGRALRAARILAGLRQDELAIRAHVGRTTIVRLEKGLQVHPCIRASVERVLGIESSSEAERAQP